MTQQQAAERAGITRERWNRYEAGAHQPSARRLRALAEALGAQPRDLVELPGAGTVSLADLRYAAGLSQQDVADNSPFWATSSSYAHVEQARRAQLADDHAAFLAGLFNVSNHDVRSAWINAADRTGSGGDL